MTAVALAEPPAAAPAAEGTARLGVRGVSLVYTSRRGPIQAIEALSLDVAEGEFVSILGPSGCGKSSLLRLVAGLARPSSGQLLVAGTPVRGPRRDVGMVFQKPTLLPWKTVLGNVLLPARTLGLESGAARARALDLLERVGLRDFARNYPFELSGGMQQRVGLARMLLHDPALLLMDEPFAALDALTREDLMLELQRIWQESRKSVLFVTHSIPEAVFLSDRVLIMSPRPGRIVCEHRIGLPRPRDRDVLASAKFAAIGGMLRQALDAGRAP